MRAGARRFDGRSAGRRRIVGIVAIPTIAFLATSCVIVVPPEDLDEHALGIRLPPAPFWPVVSGSVFLPSEAPDRALVLDERGGVRLEEWREGRETILFDNGEGSVVRWPGTISAGERPGAEFGRAFPTLECTFAGERWLFGEDAIFTMSPGGRAIAIFELAPPPGDDAGPEAIWRWLQPGLVIRCAGKPGRVAGPAMVSEVTTLAVDDSGDAAIACGGAVLLVRPEGAGVLRLAGAAPAGPAPAFFHVEDSGGAEGGIGAGIGWVASEDRSPGGRFSMVRRGAWRADDRVVLGAEMLQLSREYSILIGVTRPAPATAFGGILALDPDGELVRITRRA